MRAAVAQGLGGLIALLALAMLLSAGSAADTGQTPAKCRETPAGVPKPKSAEITTIGVRRGWRRLTFTSAKLR